jgi:DNA topoisomerase VI subunit A
MITVFLFVIEMIRSGKVREQREIFVKGEETNVVLSKKNDFD